MWWRVKCFFNIRESSLSKALHAAREEIKILNATIEKNKEDIFLFQKLNRTPYKTIVVPTNHVQQLYGDCEKILKKEKNKIKSLGYEFVYLKKNGDEIWAKYNNEFEK